VSSLLASICKPKNDAHTWCFKAQFTYESWDKNWQFMSGSTPTFIAKKRDNRLKVILRFVRFATFPTAVGAESPPTHIWRPAMMEQGAGAKDSQIGIKIMKTRIFEVICTTEEIDRMVHTLIRECQEIQSTCKTQEIQDIATDVIDALVAMDAHMEYADNLSSDFV